jgi:hypothetical protein
MELGLMVCILDFSNLSNCVRLGELNKKFRTWMFNVFSSVHIYHVLPTAAVPSIANGLHTTMLPDQSLDSNEMITQQSALTDPISL